MYPQFQTDKHSSCTDSREELHEQDIRVFVLAAGRNCKKPKVIPLMTEQIESIESITISRDWFMFLTRDSINLSVVPRDKAQRELARPPLSRLSTDL